MRDLIFVGSGGFIGAASRYYLGSLIVQLGCCQRFPLATLSVNIMGCLLIGLLTELSTQLHILSTESKLFLVTGILGGFTTFSAFGHEAVALVRSGESLLGFLYVFLSILFCLGAVCAGIWIAQQISN